MKVTVYGAGAIGGTTGAALARPDTTCCSWTATLPHVEAINAHGLTDRARRPGHDHARAAR